MKIVISFLIVFLFFFVGCTEDCDSGGYDYIRLISTIELDGVASEVTFQKGCFEKPYCYEAKVDEKSMDSTSIIAISVKDTLHYLVDRKKWSDVYIVVDTIPIESCRSVHWLADRGTGHYRVDSKRLYSCVFFYEPSCP